MLNSSLVVWELCFRSCSFCFLWAFVRRLLLQVHRAAFLCDCKSSFGLSQSVTDHWDHFERRAWNINTVTLWWLLMIWIHQGQSFSQFNGCLNEILNTSPTYNKHFVLYVFILDDIWDDLTACFLSMRQISTYWSLWGCDILSYKLLCVWETTYYSSSVFCS